MTKNWLMLVIVLALSLSACGPEISTTIETPTEAVVPETEAPVVTEAPTEPPATEEPAATEVPTEPPTDEPLVCVELLTPENGIELYPIGKVTFSWTALDGADTYLLTFTLPSGENMTFETDGTPATATWKPSRRAANNSGT